MFEHTHESNDNMILSKHAFELKKTPTSLESSSQSHTQHSTAQRAQDAIYENLFEKWLICVIVFDFFFLEGSNHSKSNDQWNLVETPKTIQLIWIDFFCSLVTRTS